MCCAALYDRFSVFNTGAAAALIFAGADITATDNTGYSPHCFGFVQAAGANGGRARRLTAEDMAGRSPKYTEAVRKVSRVQRSIARRRWSSACHLRRTRRLATGRVAVSAPGP